MLAIVKVKKFIMSDFEMKNLRVSKKIIRMKTKNNRDNDKLYLTYMSYLERILKKYVMTYVKPTYIPLGQQFNLYNALCLKNE